MLLLPVKKRFISGCRCVDAGAALLGGETAIMPDLYSPGDLDMAGFCVGVVEKDELIDGTTIEAGDVIIGVASDGLHSNGYSRVRGLSFDQLSSVGGSTHGYMLKQLSLQRNNVIKRPAKPSTNCSGL